MTLTIMSHRFLGLLFACLLLVSCASRDSRIDSSMEIALPPGTDALSLYAERSGDVWWLDADGRRLHRFDMMRRVHEPIAVDLPAPAGRLNVDTQGRLWLLGRDGAPLLAIRIGDGELPSRASPWRLDRGLPREGDKPPIDPGVGGFNAVSAQGPWLWLAQPGKLLRVTLRDAA